ncbi:putative membrane protein [Propionispora sp. 2/2-37]|nr:hypothetical protein [Propionispora sp. 2/2-37]CUH97248.1 putative membrane protein [Propionispora sp. 2/2-37]
MEWLDGLTVFVWLALNAVFIVGTFLIAGAIWTFWELYKALIGVKLGD